MISSILLPLPLDKKTKKDEQTYFLIKNQLQFLDVCNCKEYNKPSSFHSSIEVNHFVDTYATKEILWRSWKNVNPKFFHLFLFSFHFSYYSIFFLFYIILHFHISINLIMIRHVKLLLNTFNISYANIENQHT